MTKLISIVIKYRLMLMDDLFKNRKIATKKILWNRIASQMNDEGYNVSAIQVENKYKSLERAYKNMISNNKKTGRGCISCPYEAELTDLLGSKHNIEPLVLSGRQGLILKKNTTTNISLSVDDNSDNSNDPVQLTVTPNTIQSYTEVTTRNNAIATTNNNSNQLNIGKEIWKKGNGPYSKIFGQLSEKYGNTYF
ncbi:trihelix transcription factor GT-2-like isoform X2 [Harpegnathos saltator]|uniref:trihelix transcription factor GT-2-like isoform X2 n=1 Tax=Harpegnathos saltator TaxID=610380 RepID=UPI0009490B99|nr:trihelix transcription factor GT-2-like isoform X2 [Harpegnathos saltator]